MRTRASKSNDADVAKRVAAQVTSDFNSRFTRIEKAIEALATANKSEELASKRKKRQLETEEDQSPPVPKPKKIPSAAAGRPTPVSNFEEERIETPECQAPALAAIPELAHSHASRHHAPKPVTSQQPQQQEVASQLVNKPNWSSWMIDNMNSARNDVVPLPLSTRDISPDDDIHAKVQEVLNNTASRVGKSNKTGEFPYQYVLRGPEKRKAGINSVTLPEHIWGIICMMKDSTVPNDIKPALLEHIEQICDDCREYVWGSAVRRWSEEVFSLIAEHRLERGWHTTNAIQMLRFSISRDTTARINTSRDQPMRARQYNQPTEALRGGPPCPDFNLQRGCTLPSGHQLHGKRMMHICSFCLMNSAATYPHAETVCRNKAKLSQAHF